MKQSCVLLACLIVLAGAAKAEARFKIAYTFTPEFMGAVPVLHVELQFQGGSSGINSGSSDNLGG
ncbi:MAG: hypothetical protein ABR907_17095 [Terracidiphilus sp.]|jgi:hypothetical protein